jgi:hypothetical protein
MYRKAAQKNKKKGAKNNYKKHQPTTLKRRGNKGVNNFLK